MTPMITTLEQFLEQVPKNDWHLTQYGEIRRFADRPDGQRCVQCPLSSLVDKPIGNFLQAYKLFDKNDAGTLLAREIWRASDGLATANSDIRNKLLKILIDHEN